MRNSVLLLLICMMLLSLTVFVPQYISVKILADRIEITTNFRAWAQIDDTIYPIYCKTTLPLRSLTIGVY